MAEDGPFGTPPLDPKIPPKKFMWVPFWRPFPGNEAHKLFSGGPKWGVLGGGQKVYAEKVYVLFLSPRKSLFSNPFRVFLTPAPRGPSSLLFRLFFFFRSFLGRGLFWAISTVRLALHFPEEIPEKNFKTPETLSERFLEFPSRVRLGSPKPYNSRHLRLPKPFQNSLPPSTAGDASFFFRNGFEEGLSEPLSWNSEQYWGYF